MSAADCLFCRLARGDLPTDPVYQSDDLLAFLDIHPIRPGHTLIIPRRHYPYYDDLPTPVVAEIMALGQRLAPVLRARYQVERVAFFFTGVDIAHAHAHVVPMFERTDITSPTYIAERPLSFRPAPRADATELASVAEALRQGLAAG